jgi:hypothetical protein
MTVPCIVEIDGVSYKPRKPYVFATLPRIGETICLEWDEDGDGYASYVVYGVRHVPDDVQEIPACTVLWVKKVPF